MTAVSQVTRATHESEMWLYYAPVGDDSEAYVDYDGLDPYWALADLLINEFDGYHELSDVEINGERWDIRMNYSKSGFQPRPEDEIASDRLYEFDINARGRGERKCDYNISPRFPDMRKSDGERTTTAFDHTEPDEGVSVHCQPSNLEPDEVADLLPRLVFELANAADLGLYHGYFAEPFDGRITALERYVRLTRSMNEKLIGTGGIFDRLAMLLSDADGTKGVYKFDNERERGYHHVVRHGSTSAGEMVSGHRLGGQIKSYLPEHPEKFEPEDPLFHPKLGVKFVQGRTAAGSVPWSERDEVVRELDERLVSLLSWAEIPTEAGGTTYVADDHFGAGAAAESVPIHSDPTPRLEANQEHLIVTTLRDMTSADEAIVENLATDGGQPARKVADAAGVGLSTVYRCLQRLEGVVTSDNGHVRFVSEKLRQEIRAIVESAETKIESAADRAAQLVDMDVRQSASSAFDRWLAKYGAEFDAPSSEGERPTVRIDTVLSKHKASTNPRVDDVLDKMLDAWTNDGRDPRDLKRAIVEVSVDGTSMRRPVATLH
ncbi:hypothetical protein C475_14438 [Halosimplex carlsbadense 2-9-1]|uniref:DUF7845 domain-containing protein n=1 Tax=Halosimplex carlsbadense 2-9-1 TaxID=797114 RepID=M0CNP1_9EURY|nr:hypothetical protein C475_14438 [Halosimplex carlsbadense 2-9-1]